MWHRVYARLRSLWRRRRQEAEFDEEIRFHLAEETNQRVEAGLSPEQARAAARRDFGNVTLIRELTRETWGWGSAERFLQDVRWALRTMRRNRGFSAAAVGTLALGIASATAIFCVVSATLLTPPPYFEPERLMVLWETDRRTGGVREGLSAPDYVDLVERQQVFEDVAAYRTTPRTLTSTEQPPERVQASAVTHGFFDVYRRGPSFGRTFTESDGLPGAPRVAILNGGIWQSRFAGDVEVVGRSVTLDGEDYTVVGVFAELMQIPWATTDLWTPLSVSEVGGRGRHVLGAVGRLRAGVTEMQALADLDRIGRQLEAEFPADNAGRELRGVSLPEDLASSVRPTLLLLLAAVGALLVITSVNIASMHLARAIDRSRELAVRVAVGATPLRCVRGFLVEGLVLAVMAGGIGLLLASYAISLLVAFLPVTPPSGGAIAIDWRTFVFAWTVTALTGAFVGVLPAFELRRRDLAVRLTEQGRGSTGGSLSIRLRRALVVGEIALSFVLLVGAGLLVKSLWQLASVDPGFRPPELLKAQLQLPASRYEQSFATFPDWPEVKAFTRDVLTRIGRIPGVDAVALASSHPLDPGFTSSFSIGGRPPLRPDQTEEIRVRTVSAGYFATAGIPLVEGRLLAERDREGQPLVAVINESAARRHFADAEPVGAVISVFGRPFRIVGVVGNERFMGLHQDVPPAVYPHLAQMPASGLSLLVRSGGDQGGLVSRLRRDVAAVDPDLALYDVESMTRAIENMIGQPRVNSTLVAIFASLAWLLTLLGVHGVVSYSVTRREREICLRMALGASPFAILRSMLSEGVLMGIVGLTVGLGGAFLGSRALGAVPHTPDSLDVVVLAAVAAVLLASVLVATYVPTRRVMAMDAGLLRSE